MNKWLFPFWKQLLNMVQFQGKCKIQPIESDFDKFVKEIENKR